MAGGMVILVHPSTSKVDQAQGIREQFRRNRVKLVDCLLAHLKLAWAWAWLQLRAPSVKSTFSLSALVKAWAGSDTIL